MGEIRLGNRLGIADPAETVISSTCYPVGPMGFCDLRDGRKKVLGLLTTLEYKVAFNRHDIRMPVL